MPTVLNYNATVVTPAAGGVAIPIAHSPSLTQVAQVVINVPNSNTRFVEVKATVGVQGTSDIGSLLFRLFRDGGIQVYTAQQDLLNGFTEAEVITLQAVDGNATVGPHVYTLTVEVLSPSGLTANIFGPVDISATVYG